MGYELQKLQSKHMAMMDLEIQGFDDKEIASQLGVTVATVHNVTKSTFYQDALAVRRARTERTNDQTSAVKIANARTILEDGAEEAAKELKRLVKSGSDDRVKLAASNSLLEKVGLDSRERGNENGLTFTLPLSQLTKFKLILAEDRDDFTESETDGGKIPTSNDRKVESRVVDGVAVVEQQQGDLSTSLDQSLSDEPEAGSGRNSCTLGDSMSPSPADPTTIASASVASAA